MDLYARELLNDAGTHGRQLSPQQVLRCVQSDDPIVWLELYEQQRAYQGAWTSIPSTVYEAFLLKYFRHTLENDCSEINSRYPTRFEAAHECADWFRFMWNRKDQFESALSRLKFAWADLCQHSIGDVREAVLLGILEHIIYEPGVFKFFYDWLSNTKLRPILIEARRISPDETG